LTVGGRSRGGAQGGGRREHKRGQKHGGGADGVGHAEVMRLLLRWQEQWRAFVRYCEVGWRTEMSWAGTGCMMRRGD